MKILVLCDEGNNRSVVLAHHLKYWSHDVIAAGIKRNNMDTLKMLYNWSDRTILTDSDQYGQLWVDPHSLPKLQLWHIGPDHFPRPFHPELTRIVRRLMTEHRDEYKN